MSAYSERKTVPFEVPFFLFHAPLFSVLKTECLRNVSQRFSLLLVSCLHENHTPVRKHADEREGSKTLKSHWTRLL